MARRTRDDAWLWLLLLLIVGGLGGLTAASSLYRGVLTLRYLSGIASAWSAYAQTPYATTYYGAWQQTGVPALTLIARLIRAGSQEAARIALEQWLAAFDPMYLVRDAIKGGRIVEGYLFDEAADPEP